MDGIPALDLWDLVIDVFHSSANQTNKTKDDRGSLGNLWVKTQPSMRKQIPTTHTNLDLTTIDHVPSSVTLCGSNAMWYVFEDNEAVIKMIITGRSPTMRHVSRTHGVALDWLFDRINLDQTPTRRHSDKGQFHTWWMESSSPSVQDQHFSLASCSQAMSTRMQHLTGKQRIVAKLKPTLNLVLQTAASSCTAPSSNASNRPGIFRAPSQQGLSLIASAACSWRFESKWRSVEFPSVANRCEDERNCDETRCCRHEPGSEFSRKCKATCRWKVWTSTTRTTRSRRKNSAYLVLTYHILRKSTRIRDDNSNARQKPKWRITIRIRWYGERLCWSPSKQQFIWALNIWRIYIQPKISHKEQWNNCPMEPRSWSVNRPKFTEYPWSTCKKSHGKGRFCSTTEQFSCPQRKSTYSPIQYCPWEQSPILP